MEKNYAYNCGAFMALAKMMRDKIRELDSDDEHTRKWARRTLDSLADQTDDTLAELGYEKEVDIA